MAPPSKRRSRSRGTIDQLPSGALRVRVYAGVDPVTKRRHDLTEVVPAGPRAATLAEQTLTRLLNQVDEKRNPRTVSTVNQLLDQHLAMLDVDRSTLLNYQGQLRLHVRPFVGGEKVGAIDATVLDSLYAELRRCRAHCRNPRGVDHRTNRPHECDQRCGPHVCRPLSASSIRQIHHVLSGAFKRAVRWRWVGVNPMTQAEPPRAPKPDPQPPSAPDAARIVNEAWRRDPDWGVLVWLALTTGARRGELCGLRWTHVDIVGAVLTLRRSIAQHGGEIWEKDTKTHQQRRVVLDPETVAALTEHWERHAARAAAIGVKLGSDAFVFSLAPDGSTHLQPSAVTHRYAQQVASQGIKTTLHKLRHYNATELIAAGVDVRTVAGRLGHSGGGTTTLRVYSAWIAESDQRAAAALTSRMPDRPSGQLDPAQRAAAEPRAPFERIATELRWLIDDGTLPVGSLLPTIKELASQYEVSVGTAYRAAALLSAWGLVEVSRGRRGVITAAPVPALDAEDHAQQRGLHPEPEPEPDAATGRRRLLDLVVRRRGYVVADFSAESDPDDAGELHRLLVDAVRRDGRDESDLSDFTLEVSDAATKTRVRTFVAPSR